MDEDRPTSPGDEPVDTPAAETAAEPTDTGTAGGPTWTGPGPSDTTTQAGPAFGHGPRAATDEPPPVTAFAWRHGLVRPAQGRGRVFAGVCGAIARATNTDPVLWRVILVVLSLFGGVGVLLYLLGWILLPADGDTAAPVEALIWRGRSSTSTTLTVIVAIIVLIALGVSFSERFSPGVPGVILIVVAAILLLQDRRRPRPVESAPAPPPTISSVDTPSGGAMSTPTAFAPYGPFSPTPPSSPAPPEPAQRPARRPRSRLGRLTFSIALLVVGVIALADLSGLSVPTATYLAAALAVIGLGMVVGAWYGRGRGLIGLGIIVSLLLGAFGTLSLGRGFHGGDITWRPTSVSQVESSYDNQFGDGTLDLSAVDFAQAGGPVNVHVGVHFGNLTVILPPNVDTDVTVKVQAGNADVFDQQWSGVNSGAQHASSLGADGVGGGQLNLDGSVNFGNLEVRR